jgi:sigma-B regulation protein RsbU (phosphoserine phosphatase)
MVESGAIEDINLDQAYGDLLPSAESTNAISQFFGLDIASMFIAPPPLGGDIWGMAALDDSRLSLFSVDVSGHGAQIAPLTKWIHGLIVQQQKIDPEPVSMVSALNRALFKSLMRGKFATLFYGIIDIANDSLSYSCSAVPPPLLRTGAPGEFACIPGEGLPLGFVEDTTYDLHQYPFRKGAALVLYSDALVETPHPPHEVFTPESLKTFVNAVGAQQTSHDIVTAIMTQLDIETNVLKDDLTLVAMRRL